MVAEIVNLAVWKRKHSSGAVVDPIVATWKCRELHCITRVGVTQTAIDTLAFFNAYLKANRLRAIAEHEVMCCAAHPLVTP